MATEILTAPPVRSTAPATDFTVSGMTCQNCVRHVTDAIQSVPGVASAIVQLEKGRVTVRWRPRASPDAKPILTAIQAAGYEAQPLDADSCDEAGTAWSPLSSWKFNVVVGLAATVPLMIGEWVFQFGMQRWFQWAGFALALMVQIFCGARFYRGAWNQLKVGSSNMDTLVALGSTTAFVYSAWGLFASWSGHLYFMKAAARAVAGILGFQRKGAKARLTFVAIS